MIGQVMSNLVLLRFGRSGIGGGLPAKDTATTPGIALPPHISVFAKASDVCRKIEQFVKEKHGRDRRFTASHHHVRAWQFYGVRPKKGDRNPERTDVRYRRYDAAHKDYVYTDQWVAFLIREFQKNGQFEAAMSGKMPWSASWSPNQIARWAPRVASNVTPCCQSGIGF